MDAEATPETLLARELENTAAAVLGRLAAAGDPIAEWAVGYTAAPAATYAETMSQLNVAGYEEAPFDLPPPGLTPPPSSGLPPPQPSPERGAGRLHGADEDAAAVRVQSAACGRIAQNVAAMPPHNLQRHVVPAAGEARGELGGTADGGSTKLLSSRSSDSDSSILGEGEAEYLASFGIGAAAGEWGDARKQKEKLGTAQAGSRQRPPPQLGRAAAGQGEAYARAARQGAYTWHGGKQQRWGTASRQDLVISELLTSENSVELPDTEADQEGLSLYHPVADQHRRHRLHHRRSLTNLHAALERSEADVVFGGSELSRDESVELDEMDSIEARLWEGLRPPEPSQRSEPARAAGGTGLVALARVQVNARRYKGVGLILAKAGDAAYYIKTSQGDCFWTTDARLAPLGLEPIPEAAWDSWFEAEALEAAAVEQAVTAARLADARSAHAAESAAGAAASHGAAAAAYLACTHGGGRRGLWIAANYRASCCLVAAGRPAEAAVHRRLGRAADAEWADALLVRGIRDPAALEPECVTAALLHDVGARLHADLGRADGCYATFGTAGTFEDPHPERAAVAAEVAELRGAIAALRGPPATCAARAPRVARAGVKQVGPKPAWVEPSHAAGPCGFGSKEPTYRDDGGYVPWSASEGLGMEGLVAGKQAGRHGLSGEQRRRKAEPAVRPASRDGRPPAAAQHASRHSRHSRAREVGAQPRGDFLRRSWPGKGGGNGAWPPRATLR
jgi:hypothetical protein